MALTDYKIKDEDFSSKDIASLSDRPSADGLGANALKERFDAGAKKVIAPKINALIEELAGALGASGIGVTTIDGVAGYNVQSVLAAIKVLLDAKKETEVSDRELALKFDTANAQGLVKDVQVDLTTGVITVVKYDNTTATFDTALEKVALDVRLDGQEFVLTLADGTEQRVNLSAFLTETEVANTDTINLSIENNAIVARVVSKSIKLSHLADEVTAYIAEKEASASASASAAAVSEANALSSANTAEQAKNTALQCQQDACTCASNALQSETNAAASESSAQSAAERAEAAAEKAETIAGGDFVETPTFEAHVNNQSNPHAVTAEQVGARPNTWTPTASDVGALPLDGSVAMTGTLQYTDGTNTYDYYGEHNPPTYSDVGASPKFVGLITGYDDILAWAKAQTYGSVCGFYTVSNTPNNLPANYAGYAFVYCSGAGGWAIDVFIPLTKQRFTNATNAGTWQGWTEAYTTANITKGTTDLTAGSSSLKDGFIHIVYE